jgi:cobalamin biosynthetic protein CobC
MAGVVHGGGLTAAMAHHGGAREDWLDLSTGINPNMPDLPEIPAEMWNRLPDSGLVEEARAAARDFYLPQSVEAPPSVLPDISPTSGENGRGTVAASSRSRSGGNQNKSEWRARPRRESLSPPVGEMPGRAEGGTRTDKFGAVDKTRTIFAPLSIPGTQSLIQILPRLVPQNRPVAILSPTYGEYAHCFAKAGFEVDAIRSLDTIRSDHGTIIVVNPNNPDGRAFSRETLLGLYASMRGQGAHLHIDEAFGDACPELTLAREASELPGLTVSRSFGKFFGMAGIRLGFVFAHRYMLEAIEAELGPWAVSGPALYAAKELMGRDRAAILGRIRERKAALDAVLNGAGLMIVGGTELFTLVAHERAESLFEHLARSHILVRKFDYASDWLRIGLAPDEQGDRKLAGALASFRA